MKYNETTLPAINTHGTGECRLDFEASYLLEFEAGDLPPVYDFWSVSVYHPPSLERWSIHYSVGEWCDNLVFEADGSLRLYLQHAAPASNTNNWIPTPLGQYGAELHIYELPAGREGAVHTFTLSSLSFGKRTSWTNAALC
ncbi:MAG: DUF1214 domain-containing protein [Proteobacteria bacterium]|nr:DUF1214 domain-containing protein [Pseudomonadota bacterium]